MAGDTNNAEADADRLEAALERLAAMASPATLARVRRTAVPSDDQRAGTDLPPMVDEITTRLDGLIGRLRTALGGRPG